MCVYILLLSYYLLLFQSPYNFSLTEPVLSNYPKTHLKFFFLKHGFLTMTMYNFLFERNIITGEFFKESSVTFQTVMSFDSYNTH